MTLRLRHRHRRRIALGAVSVLLLAATGMGAIAARSQTTPRRDDLLILDPTTSTANPVAAAAEDANANTIVDMAAKDDDRLLIDVVDGQPLAHPSAAGPFDFHTGGADVASFDAADRKQSLVAAAKAAVATVLHRPRAASRSDWIAALVAAGDHLDALEANDPPHTAVRPRLVVGVGDWANTAAGRNFSAVTLDQSAVRSLVNGLAGDGLLAHLGGAAVWAVGPGIGADQPGPAKLAQIHSAWSAIIAADDGTLTRWTDRVLAGS